MTAPTTVRMANLELATETRRRRGQLRRELGNGEVHLADLLADPPDWAERMRLVDVLVALPRVWKANARRALKAAQASEYTTLGNLTARRRELLLDHFRREHLAVWQLWNVMAGKDGK